MKILDSKVNYCKTEVDIDAEIVLKINQEIDAKAKVIFASGLPPYGKGVSGLVSTGFQAQQTVSSLDLNPMIIAKIGSLLFIAKNTPGAITLFSNSTGTMMDFASTNEIDTKPLEEAKDAMGD